MTTPFASEVSFNEALLRVASAHNRTVAFRYSKGDNLPIESRALVPSAVHTSKADQVVFSGFDPDRGAVRAFRVDRIKGDVTVLPHA